MRGRRLDELDEHDLLALGFAMPKGATAEDGERGIVLKTAPEPTEAESKHLRAAAERFARLEVERSERTLAAEVRDVAQRKRAAAARDALAKVKQAEGEALRLFRLRRALKLRIAQGSLVLLDDAYWERMQDGDWEMSFDVSSCGGYGHERCGGCYTCLRTQFPDAFEDVTLEQLYVEGDLEEDGLWIQCPVCAYEAPCWRCKARLGPNVTHVRAHDDDDEGAEVWTQLRIRRFCTCEGTPRIDVDEYYDTQGAEPVCGICAGTRLCVGDATCDLCCGTGEMSCGTDFETGAPLGRRCETCAGTGSIPYLLRHDAREAALRAVARWDAEAEAADGASIMEDF